MVWTFSQKIIELKPFLHLANLFPQTVETVRTCLFILCVHSCFHFASREQAAIELKNRLYYPMFIVHAPVVQSWVSTNPGLKFNPLFKFLYSYTSAHFKKRRDLKVPSI